MYPLSEPSSRNTRAPSVLPAIATVLSGLCAVAVPALLGASLAVLDEATKDALLGAAGACAVIPAIAVMSVIVMRWSESREYEHRRQEGIRYAAESDRQFAARSARGDNRTLEELEAALAG